MPTPAATITTADGERRLRRSCDACASAKLKCSQEKPTCRRCAKRGTVCEYVASKRGCNKKRQASRGNLTDNLDISEHNHYDYDCAAPGDAHFPLPVTGIVDTQIAASVDWSPLDSSFQQMPFFGGSPTVSASTSHDSLNELLSAWQESNTSAQPPLSDRGMISPTLPAWDNILAMGERWPDPMAVQPTLTGASNDNDKPVDQDCSCLPLALGLMGQLFGPTSAACMKQLCEMKDKDDAIPTVTEVIAKNKHIISVISSILNCSCMQDCYLLVILALTAFKLLSWYAAIARMASIPDGHHEEHESDDRHQQGSPCSERVLDQPVTIGRYYSDGEDFRRVAAQLVLSELHHIRRFVDQLSPKLQIESAKQSPLFAVILEKMDADLKATLKTLSSQIRNGLRHM